MVEHDAMVGQLLAKLEELGIADNTIVMYSTDNGAHEDMLSTLLAAAGDTSVKEDLLKGEAEWPRHDFLYWTDDGSVAAVRYNNWKVTFMRQNAHGVDVWTNPYQVLRAPMITNLRMDPFERAEYESMGYTRWWRQVIPCCLAFIERINGGRCLGTVRRFFTQFGFCGWAILTIPLHLVGYRQTLSRLPPPLQLTEPLFCPTHRTT